jgi:hypothetical protein
VESAYRKLGTNFLRLVFHFQQFFRGIIDEKLCVCTSARSYGKDAEYCANASEFFAFKTSAAPTSARSRSAWK